MGYIRHCPVVKKDRECLFWSVILRLLSGRRISIRPEYIKGIINRDLFPQR